jgi:hypothetical protein
LFKDFGTEAGMNAFDIFGIPSEFGLSLLMLSLILFLSPYFSGVDFGVIKIPKLTLKAKKRLKITGPLLIIGVSSLFTPYWSEFFSPLEIQNMRIGQSDTNYRFEITVKNPNFREDKLINHIVLHTGLPPISECNSVPTTFHISDNLIIQQVSNKQSFFRTEMTENQDTEFSYEVTGFFREGACYESIFSFGFQTSLLVPRNSTVQFYIFLPRNLRATEAQPASPDDNNIISLRRDILYNSRRVSISIWYAGTEEPVEFTVYEPY